MLGERSRLLFPSSRMAANHMDIGLVSMLLKLLSSVILWRLNNTRERRIRQEQAVFRIDRECIDRISTLSTGVWAPFYFPKARDRHVRAKFECLLGNRASETHVSVLKEMHCHT